jgi:hypothetical protein
MYDKTSQKWIKEGVKVELASESGEFRGLIVKVAGDRVVFADIATGELTEQNKFKFFCRYVPVDRS